MQSKISFFNPTIFKKNLTRFWPFALLYLIYLLVVYPLVIYTECNQLMYYDSDRTASSVIMDYFANTTEPISIFIAAIVIAIAVFSYLYQSRSANMIHSFPVTRTQLFVTNYVSGLALLFLAQFLGALFTNLIILGKAAGTIWIVWAWFGITVGETLFFYSFAVLMVMFTGQVLTAGLFYLIWSFLYIVVVVLINSMGSLFLYGIDGDLIGIGSHPLFPLWYLMHRVGFHVNDSSTVCQTQGIVILAAYMAVGVVLTVLAWWIYRHRRVECAGDFLSMKWTAPVFRWGVVLVGGIGCALFVTYLVNDGYGSWNARIARFVISLIISSVILFFASEMFIEKSFRVFHKRLIVECASCVAVLLVGVAVVHFDVFGVESYVPETEKIAMVSFSYDTGEVDFEDAGHIAEVAAVHQMIVDNLDVQKKNTDGTGYSLADAVDDSSVAFSGYVSIHYTLKNGNYVKRDYPVLIRDQQFGEQFRGQLQKVSGDADGSLSAVLGLNHEELDWKVSYVGLSIPVRSEDGDGWYYDGSQDVSIDTEENRQVIYDAWLADIASGALTPGDDSTESFPATVQLQFETKAHLSQIRYPEGSSLAYKLIDYDQRGGGVSSYQDVYLNDHCTNLIEALKQIGVIKGIEDLQG